MISYAGRHRPAAPKRSEAVVKSTARRILPATAAAALAVGAAGAAVADATATGSLGQATTAIATSLTTPSAASTLAAETAQARAEQDRLDSRAADLAAAAAAAQSRDAAEFAAARSDQRRDALLRQAAVASEKKAAAARQRAKVRAAHRWVMPLKSPNQTSGFGFRWGRLHAGLDFGAPVGTPLRSMSSGTVIDAGWAGGYGMRVEIKYWDGTVSYFAHMSQIAVAKGQRVAPGTFVGKTGNTGHSTGPHLHLEIHPHGGEPLDPAAWLRSHHVKF